MAEALRDLDLWADLIFAALPAIALLMFIAQREAGY